MGHDRPEYTGVRWFTSSYSSGSAQCVEVAFLPGHRLVRDSKLGATSPVLAVSPTEWSTFTAEVKAGRLDG
ncbi:MAG: DUF397 domain-containing protein [Pseudonocardiaceae bacterium]